MRLPLRSLGLAALLVLAACPDKDDPGADASVGKTDGGDPSADGSIPGNPDGGSLDTDGGTTGPTAEIKSCNESLPTPANGATCDVVKGSGMVLLTGTVLVPGTVYRGGQVLIDDKGKIACVDCDCSAQASGATQITCPDAVISPGLINTHDHITFANTKPPARTGERYEHRHDWRKGNDGHTKIGVSGGATQDTIAFAELRFALGGATATVGSGGAAGFLRNLDSGANQEGLGQTPVEFETFPLGDSGGTEIKTGCGYSFNDPSWNSIDAYLPHIGEGIDQAAHNEFLCTESTSGGAHDMITNKTSLIHGIAATPKDVQLMAADRARLIWSPRSNVSLYGDTAVVPLYARLGVVVALGTDWLPSGSMNLLRELKCAADLNDTYFDKYFSDEQLWMLVTSNAAQATGINDVVGVLKPGMVADVAIFAKKGRVDHRAVIEAENEDVALVLRGGKPLTGDADVVAAFADGGACDTLDVCGVAKKVCAQREVGKSLSTLTTNEQSKYPLFVCDSAAPSNEPSCQPTRNCTSGCPVGASVNGSTVYDGLPKAGDRDGDGLTDDKDDCPRVFNPIRPMDNGKQGDADGDGVGDACDPCPLDANTTACKTFDANDEDGDGVANAQDNCPAAANLDQADADGDLKGDACDACPNDANPGALACPGTIYAVKDGTLKDGDAVSISNAIVTGVGAKAFFLQIKETDASYKGPDYSGVLVYFGTAPTVKVGDRVSLRSATVKLYYGEIELISPDVVVEASEGEAAPAPIVVTGAEVGTGGARATALEGVLVQIQNATVTNASPTPDAADKTNPYEFEVTGPVRVHDFLYHVPTLPNAGDQFTAITGVLHWDFGNSKIEPRSAADLVAGAAAPAKLASLTPNTGSIREGAANAPTYTTPVAVKLVAPVLTDTVVTVASGAPADLEVVGGQVTVPAGKLSANVLFNALHPNDAVVITATLGSDTATATLKVVSATAQPTALALEPATGAVAPGGTLAMTVRIDVPAPTGGYVVTLSSAAGGSVPASVTVAEATASATFDFTAGAAEAPGVVVTASGAGGLTATATLDVKVLVTGRLVLNQISSRGEGSAGDEFVELYNGSNVEIDLSTYGLWYSSANGSTPTSQRPAFNGLKIPAGKHLLLGASGYLGTVAADASFSGGLADSATLWLTKTSAAPTKVDDPNVADVVGYGTAPKYFEGRPAPACSAGISIIRKTDGLDTDNNGDDFVTRSPRDPRNLASP